LEQYYQQAIEQGGRVRDGVARAISSRVRGEHLLSRVSLEAVQVLWLIGDETPEYTVCLDGFLPSCTCPDYQRGGRATTASTSSWRCYPVRI